MKITVVKKLTNKDIIDKYGKKVGPQCELFKVGDEFVVKDLKMPFVNRSEDIPHSWREESREP